MSEKEKINTYLLIQLNNQQLASEAHKCLENALELDFREISHVNECCLIMLPSESDLTLDELADKYSSCLALGRLKCISPEQALMAIKNISRKLDISPIWILGSDAD